MRNLTIRGSMSNFTTAYPTKTTPIPQFSPLTQNWMALDTVFDVDHTTFSEPNEVNRGHHTQVFFIAPISLPTPVPTGTQAAAFPRTSTGPITGPTQMVYQNAFSALYLLSCVKAWGTVDGATATLQEGFNISTVVSHPAPGNFVFTFTTPLAASNYAVIATATMNNSFTFGAIAGATVINASSFQINCRSLTGAVGSDVPFYFVVLQT